MIKPGLLMWIYRDESMYYVRILKLFGLGIRFLDTDVTKGVVLMFSIWKLEMDIHLGKRRGGYVERIEDQKSPTASA
tara:strand:+ start:211 stop:441 length:231 start_codon:yes stop_codon:yes gene_type:complete